MESGCASQSALRSTWVMLIVSVRPKKLCSATSGKRSRRRRIVATGMGEPA